MEEHGEDKLYPTIDEFQCPDYQCFDCKHFKYVTPKPPHGCTHRFDHAVMEYARPYFVSSPEKDGPPCSDFEPDGSYPAALPYWHGFEHWLEWKRRQNHEMHPLLKENPHPYVQFVFRGDKKEVRYKVALEDYIYGTMFEGDELKAYERSYYKMTRKGFGYKIVRERKDSNGIWRAVND